MYGIVMVVFSLKVDIYKFIIRVSANKVIRASQITSSTLGQFFLILREVQSLAGFLSFWAPAARLKWVLMQRLLGFIAEYSLSFR